MILEWWQWRHWGGEMERAGWITGRALMNEQEESEDDSRFLGHTCRGIDWVGGRGGGSVYMEMMIFWDLLRWCQTRRECLMGACWMKEWIKRFSKTRVEMWRRQVDFGTWSLMEKYQQGIQILGLSANRGFWSTGNGWKQLGNIELWEKRGWDPALRNSKT